ncbi:DUF4476 domain-containing protein [Longitalea luteola]|uniref:DUF4476 domain-containing protein n=1 Tax=Longitalea luteola TaxID=2812563 RepID=UPI001A97BF42|nr:DUF4476 domain-containing protein [Longitalea luteola]
MQSENLQPFYVQIGDKVYSSSTAGHLVISGLADKTCDFELGFPQQATRPQRFSIPLHNRDHGYQLQKNGSRGWVLYDWQTDELIKPLKEAGSGSLLYGERKKDDAFANLMAAVVNDSAVLYTSIVKKESATAPAIAGTGSKPAADLPVANADKKPVQPVDTTATEKKTDVITVVTPPAVDTASVVKTDAIPADTASQINKDVTDVPVTKYDPKEKSLTDKPDTTAQGALTKYDPQEKSLNQSPVAAGVAKIQQQSKDGETKMVFVDSSETPAKIVTVYIAEDKKAASDTPAAVITKSPEKREPVKDTAKTTVAPEPKKDEPVPPTAEKPVASLSKEEIAEQIKKETWRSVPQKKADPADTVTVVLESRQMKKAENAGETQAVYRPKDEQKAEPVKPVTRDTAVREITKPVGTGGDETPKTATNDKPGSEPVQTANTEVTAKRTEEPEEQQARVEPEKKAGADSKLVMINSDCVKLATENDVDKMRVKLVGESDSQKRLALANKYFKTMCLYAHQIKALSELFPGDEAKYKFLEMAYPFAADTANFKTLHELLTEEMYVTKFKKLVRLQ